VSLTYLKNKGNSSAPKLDLVFLVEPQISNSTISPLHTHMREVELMEGARERGSEGARERGSERARERRERGRAKRDRDKERRILIFAQMITLSVLPVISVSRVRACTQRNVKLSSSSRSGFCILRTSWTRPVNLSACTKCPRQILQIPVGVCPTSIVPFSLKTYTQYAPQVLLPHPSGFGVLSRAFRTRLDRLHNCVREGWYM
jgi:hypothetical protein